MILLLFFVAILLVALSRSALPGIAGIAEAAGSVLVDVLFRLALAGLLTTLLLAVRSVISGRHPDSR